MNKEKRDTFFLFKFGKNNLQKDERRGISKLLLTFIVIFIALDIGMLIFYQKTRVRMENMMDHPYTHLVQSNIEESSADHHQYSEGAKQTIKTHHDELRQLLDNLEFNSRELGRVHLQKLEGLDELNKTLIGLENDQHNEVLWADAQKAVSKISTSMKRVNDGLKPLQTFVEYNDALDNSLKTVLQEIKNNLDGFLTKLLSLAHVRHNSQKTLYDQMMTTIRNFNTTYDGIVDDKGKYIKLNNFYTATTIPYDKNYVPFTIEFDDKYFGAKLTLDVEFDLRLPRVYFCNLRALLTSDAQFDIKFQYIDIANNNRVLFESESVKGGYKEPASFDEYFTYQLEKETHRLYLRVVSWGSSTRLHIEKLSLQCLSYRNFVE